jgi:hypothetical protein
MTKLRLARLPLALIALALIQAGGSFARTVNLGYIQLIAGSGTPAGFNILDETGPDSSVFPNMSFPVTTPVSFSDLTLFVNFSNGTDEEFAPTSHYFSVTGVGEQEFDLPTNPINSAILIGTFGATNLTLNDGAHVTISPDFAAIMENPVGNLQNNDFALVAGSPVTTPEPGLGALLAVSFGAMILLRRKSWKTITAE